jgi:uncharacterized protein (TIGR03437 family)
LGRTAQVFPDGAAAKTTSSAVESVQVQVQGMAARITYAGVQPQFPGLYQITLQLPNYVLPPGQKTVAWQIAAPVSGQVLRYDLSAN